MLAKQSAGDESITEVRLGQGIQILAPLKRKYKAKTDAHGGGGKGGKGGRGGRVVKDGQQGAKRKRGQ